MNAICAPQAHLIDGKVIALNVLQQVGSAVGELVAAGQGIKTAD